MANPAGVPGAWSLVLDEQFLELDTSIWRPGWFSSTQSEPINSEEWAGYDASHVSVSDGLLRLSLTSDPITVGGTTYPNTGALISSNPQDGRASGGFEFTHGVIEFRAQLPVSNGMIANWPATWLNGHHDAVGGGWPAAGENDVMEGLDGDASWHYHSPEHNIGGYPAGTFADGGWHTYASVWDADQITWYYDGVQVGQISGVLSHPLYIIINNTAGTPGGELLTPATMLVDYVRVWEKAEGNPVMAGYSELPKNTALDSITALGTYLSLHTADPGTTGANEVSGGSYARQQATYPSANGAQTVGSQETFTGVADTVVATHWGLWTAASAGSFLTGGALSKQPDFSQVDEFRLTATLSANG